MGKVYVEGLKAVNIGLATNCSFFKQKIKLYLKQEVSIVNKEKMKKIYFF